MPRVRCLALWDLQCVVLVIRPRSTESRHLVATETKMNGSRRCHWIKCVESHRSKAQSKANARRVETACRVSNHGMNFPVRGLPLHHLIRHIRSPCEPVHLFHFLDGVWRHTHPPPSQSIGLDPEARFEKLRKHGGGSGHKKVFHPVEKFVGSFWCRAFDCNEKCAGVGVLDEQRSPPAANSLEVTLCHSHQR